MPLDFDDDGMPIVPAVSKTPGANKEIIRSFLTEHYSKFEYSSVLLKLMELVGLASSKKTAVVPWTEIFKNPTAFIDERLFPDGIQMMDPSKLTNTDSKAFVALWQKVPFEFKAFQDKDGMHPAVYKNRAKPLPRPKKHTRFVDDVDGQEKKRKQGRKSTQQTESDGYDSDDESDVESDSITHNSEPDNHPVKNSTSVIPPIESSSDEEPATPTPKPKPFKKTQASKAAGDFNGNPARAGPAGPVLRPGTTEPANVRAPAKTKAPAKSKAPAYDNPGPAFDPATTGPTRLFVQGETPAIGEPAGPATTALSGGNSRAPATDTLASISNPNPVTPRATRSMTGATPAKSRPEVLLTRRVAPAPDRPKPKPIGKGKGKRTEVEEDLEVTMRRTSKRTLATAQQSSPAKRRRT